MPVQRTTSQDLTLAEVFKYFYVVPDYQREYVWERREVQQLLMDTYREFSDSRHAAEQSEYYLGSLIVTQGPDGSFEVIDGQQRLTTTFILFSALRSYLREINAASIPGLDDKLAAPNGHNQLRYRVVLGYEDSANLLQTIARDGVSVNGIIATTRSIDNILNSYRVIKEYLRTQFGTDQAQLKAFYDHLTTFTKVVRIQSGTVQHALKLYESINQRGVGLDALDLLKSLMFVYTPRDQFELLRAKWKSLVDQLFAWGALLEEHHRERQWRFLNFYLRQNFKMGDLKAEQLYSWFVNNEAQVGYRDKPLAFVDSLLKAAYDIGR
jgi:uncharacterized protein with ParB-like and HNH nuclease domain